MSDPREPNTGPDGRDDARHDGTEAVDSSAAAEPGRARAAGDTGSSADNAEPTPGADAPGPSDAAVPPRPPLPGDAVGDTPETADDDEASGSADAAGHGASGAGTAADEPAAFPAPVSDGGFGATSSEPGSTPDAAGAAPSGAEADAGSTDAGGKAEAEAEVDYAALAAELDRLDSTTAASPATENAEPEKKSDPWFEPADETKTFTAADAYQDTPTEPAVTASEPTAPPETTALAGSVDDGPRTVFVAAPEPPAPRGNRGAAGGIGVVATIVFGLLYGGASLLYAILVPQQEAAGDIVAMIVAIVTSWSFWVPVAVFFLAFWLFGAIVNNARWAVWVVLGILVALAAYGGHILGALFQAPFWMLTPAEVGDVVRAELLAPLAIAAFVIAREITVWFGGWVARRGARMRAENAEAVAEYERTMAAGPSGS